MQDRGNGSQAKVVRYSCRVFESCERRCLDLRGVLVGSWSDSSSLFSSAELFVVSFVDIATPSLDSRAAGISSAVSLQLFP